MIFRSLYFTEFMGGGGETRALGLGTRLFFFKKVFLGFRITQVLHQSKGRFLFLFSHEKLKLFSLRIEASKLSQDLELSKVMVTFP